MELRQLRYFVAVAEELQFARAAQRLNMAQPPLSQQIRKLETELGAELFDRTKRPIALTEAGRVLLHEARPAVQQAEYAFEATQLAARSHTGRLHLGTIGSATFQALPEILRRFRTVFPDVRVTVTELSSPQQLVALREGRISVGFLRPPVDDETLGAQTVVREPFLLALAATHRGTARESLTLADVRDEPFVMLNRSDAPGFFDRIVSMCRNAGFRPKIAQTANQFQTIVALVAAGLGVAIVPASMRRVRIDGVHYRPIADTAVDAEVAVVWRAADVSREVTKLVDVARRYGRAKR
jgi:DNA-binding transcriptional LysR family regulator